jgi:hypothetical protein
MKIFLSYRRTDSQYISDRLFQALTAVFGADAVFKDIDSTWSERKDGAAIT